MKTAYLDIETTYSGTLVGQRLFSDCENHHITVLGLRVLQEGKDSFLQLVNKDISKIALLTALKGTDLIVTYNGRSIPDGVKGYTGFDFPIIASQLGVVLDKQFKHLDLCPVCWRRGLRGGQKAIERSLRLKRNRPGRDGAWADLTWRRYEKTGDENFLRELLEYNREDVFMLRRIQESVQARKQRPRPDHFLDQTNIEQRLSANWSLIASNARADPPTGEETEDAPADER